MDKNKEPFVGECWPGLSVYLDYLNPKAREFWASQFSLENYKETTIGTFIWNDMNEPAVFNTFEKTMPKTALYFIFH